MRGSTPYIAGALLLAVFVGGIVVGAGSGDAPSSDDDASSQSVFMHGNCPIIAPLYYGVESGNVDVSDTPMRFERVPPPDIASHIEDGDAMAGITLLNQFPTLTDNVEDIKVLPYTFRVPANLTGIYVDADSDISGPADLRGASIAVPRITDGLQVLAVLDEQYNISGDDIDVTVTNLSRARTRLDSGDVDAAYVPTWVGADEPDYRRIMNARAMFAEARGHPPIAWHAVMAWDGYVDEADAMMQRMQESEQYSAANPDELLNGVSGDGALAKGYMLRAMQSDGGSIIRMSPAVQESLQELLDRGYENGIYPRRVNLSAHMVER